jgi:poly(3-hydroxybutyrate) depolymerase
LLATNLLVIKASIGKNVITFRYLPLHNGKISITPSSEYIGPGVSHGLAKMAAVVDTVKAAASNYQTKVTAITSYNQELNITLDTAAGGNTGSIGCGKDLSAIKSGTYTITSASLSRKYIINVPANYDKNKPYRLIFGMHCMGSSMDGVVSGKYYGLQTLASSANIPCIFVAPQGYTDNSPWRISDNKDHIFFDDMLKLFKENLCVDTARVFCCGFSYGAMVSYSLSIDHAKQLRAVATYAPANYNIYVPTITHDPIAYYQTTGTSDGTCPWVNSDAQKRGGKYCLLQHIEDNGCTVPSTIPTATGSTHVSTEFTGCKAGYPVKFGSFNGGHSDSNTDPGTSGNWIYKETWEFFMRF